MRTPQKRCRHCHRWFDPYPPQKDNQEFCSRKRCQRERHRQGCQRFRRCNSDHDDGRRIKIRTWAHREGYWSYWRGQEKNAGYRRRERARMRKKRKQTKRVSNRT